MEGGEFIHVGEGGSVEGEKLGGAIELVLRDKGTRDNLYSLIEEGVGPDGLREELASDRQVLNRRIWSGSPDYDDQSARVRAMRDVERALEGRESRKVMNDLTRIAGELREKEVQQAAAEEQRVIPEQVQPTSEPVQARETLFRWARIRSLFGGEER